MDLKKFSDEGLKALHNAIRKALDFDRANPDNQLNGGDFHGVEHMPEWGEWRNSLEQEMSARELAFDPVLWTQIGEY